LEFDIFLDFFGLLGYIPKGRIQFVKIVRRKSRTDKFFVVEIEVSALPDLTDGWQGSEMRKLI